MRQIWKQVVAIMVFGAFAIGGAAAQTQLTPGKDYLAITPPQPTPPGKTIEVIEFFWYGCPHCSQLQPSLKKWLQSKPADVTFRSQPAAFDESWAQLGRAYFAVETIGALETLHPEIFTAIHKTKKLDPKVLLKDPKPLFAWVGTQNQDAKKFADAYNSFSVVSKANRLIDTTSAYGVSGTPSIAVDGRYLIAPHMASSKSGAVDYGTFFRNVDQLIAMARASRKGK